MRNLKLLLLPSIFLCLLWSGCKETPEQKTANKYLELISIPSKTKLNNSQRKMTSYTTYAYWNDVSNLIKALMEVMPGNNLHYNSAGSKVFSHTINMINDLPKVKVDDSALVPIDDLLLIMIEMRDRILETEKPLKEIAKESAKKAADTYFSGSNPFIVTYQDIKEEYYRTKRIKEIQYRIDSTQIILNERYRNLNLKFNDIKFITAYQE